MSPAAVNHYRWVSTTIDKVRYRGFHFIAGEVDEVVYIQAIPPAGWCMKPSKLLFVPERTTKLGIVQLALDAVRSSMSEDVHHLLTWDGSTPFARSG